MAPSGSELLKHVVEKLINPFKIDAFDCKNSPLVEISKCCPLINDNGVCSVTFMNCVKQGQKYIVNLSHLHRNRAVPKVTKMSSIT